MAANSRWFPGLLGLLRGDGTMVNVGAPVNPASVHAFTLIIGRRSLAGSAIGGIRDTQKMLDFCAEHHSGTEVEKITVDQVNEADERGVDSDVRYRFVVDTASFG